VSALNRADESSEREQLYRLEGLSCTNCAATFERNVKQLPGVRDAKVNFGASKLAVIGDATVLELEEAGAFDRLKVIPEGRSREAKQASAERKEPFMQRHRSLLIASLFLALAYGSQYAIGGDNAIAAVLFAASIATGGYSLFAAGIRNVVQLKFDMKTLMTVAIIGATAIGEWAEGAIVVILFAVSEALERYSMDRARRSIRSLMDIAPHEATVRRNGQEISVSVDDVVVGDRMIVKPGQKIAMDGIVVSGHSTVNQAAITGESAPVEKTINDEVFAGTLNEEGLLEISVTSLADDTTIAKIIHLVEEAQGERAPAQAFVDKFAQYYTPAILIVATLTAVIPPLLFDGGWAAWIYQGLSILVVGCPCALVISTPISIVSAIGNAAKKGVLIKGGIYLEEMGGLQAVAFDKTGTLTRGKPAVTDYYVFGQSADREAIMSIIAALEHRSGHPLASAIVRQADEHGISYSNVIVDDFASITGKGIQGTVNGRMYFVGSPKMAAASGSIRFHTEQEELIASLQDDGKTVVIAGTDEEALAVIAVADEVRDSGKEVIRQLHRLGVQHTVMLTGDHRSTAAAIARELGITDVQAGLMPRDKLDAMKRLRAEYGKAAMVGDGVNDAPALAASTVGIAVGGAGTDTALETADVVLMGDDLRKLPFAIKLSRRALAIIKQNIAFALAIKAIALLLVVPGWLTLWIAILSDMGATLLVALNSMRLMRMKE